MTFGLVQQTLSDRAVTQDNLLAYLNRELIPVVRRMRAGNNTVNEFFTTNVTNQIIIGGGTGGQPSWGLITDVNVDPDAAIAVTKLAAGTASSVLTTDGATNAWAKIVNANVDAAAAIAVTKLAAGTAGQVLKTDGVTNAWGLVLNANIDPAAAVAVTKLAAGADGTFLATVLGVPTWTAPTVSFLTPGAANTALVTNGAGTLATWAKIVDANVDSAAAIAGTKISPNFGAQNVFTTGVLYAGTAATASEQAGSVVAASAASGTTRGLVSWQNSADTASAHIQTIKSRGARGVHVTVVNGDTASNWLSFVDDGTNYLSTTSIRSVVNGVVAAGSVPTDIVFLTGATGTLTEAMRVSSAQVVSLTTIAHGTSPSTTGDYRVKNLWTMKGRNTANSADYTIIQTGTSSNDDITFGASSGTRNTDVRGTTAVRIVAGTGNLQVSSGAATLVGNYLFDRTVSSPQLQHAPLIGAGTPTSLTVRAQQAFTAGVAGGHVLVQGAPTSVSGGGLKGGVELSLNGTTETLVDVKEVASGQRVLALVKGASISTTEMPANTGDRVIYIANAATNPSANPVGGGVLYCDAGALKYRGTGGTVTTLGAA